MNAIFRSAAVSWKTTLVGVLVFVEALATNLVAALDSNPDTVADWNVVVIAATAMIGLLIAKDGDKSTEDHQGV